MGYKPIFYYIVACLIFAFTGCDSNFADQQIPNQKNQKQQSKQALYLISDLVDAAKRGSKKKVLAALEAGAQINGTDRKGMTALMMASLQGHLDIVRLLIEKGAEYNFVNAQNQSAIEFAVIFDHPEVVKLFIQLGEDVTTINDRNGFLMLSSAYNKTPEALNLLIDAGLKVNRYYRKDYDKISPMQVAAERCRLENMKILLREGALIDLHDKTDGYTPLLAAAWNNCTEAVVFLVENGADVNALDNSASTALIHSAFNGNYEAVAYLLEKGADARHRNKNQKTAMDRALRGAKLFKSKKAFYDKIITLLKEKMQ